MSAQNPYFIFITQKKFFNWVSLIKSQAEKINEKPAFLIHMRPSVTLPFK
jgi:hypothetical protein